MKRYGYHRTSTKEQHLDRGITEINAYCSSNNLELEKIFTDQQTGKNFNRPRYTIRKKRLGRNKRNMMTVKADQVGVCRFVSVTIQDFGVDGNGKYSCCGSHIESLN